MQVVGVRKGGFGVVHGQDEARAPHHQFVIPTGQLPVQLLRGHGRRSAAGVDAAAVRAHRDVAVGQVDVAVRQDEVRIVVLELALVLGGRGMK